MNPLDVVYRAGTSADLTTVVSLKRYNQKLWIDVAKEAAYPWGE
jgi:hypothetical protein